MILLDTLLDLLDGMSLGSWFIVSGLILIFQVQLTYSILLLLAMKKDIKYLKKKREERNGVYVMLSEVFILEMESNVDLIKGDSQLTNFLYYKFVSVLYLIRFVINIIYLEEEKKEIPDLIVELEIARFRNSIYDYCTRHLSKEFADDNKDKNNSIFFDAKSEILRVVKSKVEKNKIEKILSAAKVMMAKTIRISSLSYNKYQKKMNGFDKLIGQNKLNEAAIELLKQDKNRDLVMNIIGEITDYEIKKTSKRFESHEQETKVLNDLRYRLQQINEINKRNN